VKLHIRMSSKWRATARASGHWARDTPLAYARCVVHCVGGANVSEAVENAIGNLRPIRAANRNYFACEENVRRKAADATGAPRISSRHLIANQKTKKVSSALYICSKRELREIRHNG
jgi:hypothetical protein